MFSNIIKMSRKRKQCFKPNFRELKLDSKYVNLLNLSGKQMKAFLLIIIFALCVISASAQEKCGENSDSLYNRQQILEQLAETLNKEIPELRKDFPTKFLVEDERAILFSVHDLTDISNKQINTKDNCVDIINNHVYHVSPISYQVSFSYIVIPEDGKLKIFSSINCAVRGDKVENVIKYLNTKLADHKNKDEIIERVKNYRNYGRYVRMCAMESLRCTPVKTDENR